MADFGLSWSMTSELVVSVGPVSGRSTGCRCPEAEIMAMLIFCLVRPALPYHPPFSTMHQACSGTSDAVGRRLEIHEKACYIDMDVTMTRRVTCHKPSAMMMRWGCGQTAGLLRMPNPVPRTSFVVLGTSTSNRHDWLLPSTCSFGATTPVPRCAGLPLA